MLQHRPLRLSFDTNPSTIILHRNRIIRLRRYSVTAALGSSTNKNFCSTGGTADAALATIVADNT
jgi:hypothetical protein